MLSTYKGHLEICADPQDVAAAVADRIILAAAKAIQARKRFVIAVAGGSSPRATYTLLAQLPRRDAVEWDKTFILFGDERCVPPTHAESNYKMVLDTLLSYVPIPHEHVFRMHGEMIPTAAATSYSEVLHALLDDHLLIDFVLLGLGPDAHTASWFPGVVIDEHVLVDAPFVPKFSGHRLTMTPPLMNGAHEIVVATTGSEKAQALAAVFGQERNPLNIPAQRIAPRNGTLTWIVDKAAAAKLPKTT